jgi:hypothetical protein
MQLMNIAKDNLKLAQLFFRNAQEKMYTGEMQKAQANSEQQTQVQIKANQAAEQEKRQTKEMEVQGDILKATTTADGQSKNAVLTGVMNIWQESMKSGVAIPAQIMALSDIVLKNVALPAMAENNEILQQMQQQMQGASQPPAMQAPEPEMAQQQEQPQQEMAA